MPDTKISEMPETVYNDTAVVPVVFAGQNFKMPASLLKGADGADGQNGTDGQDAPLRPGWYNRLTAAVIDVPTKFTKYLRLTVPANLVEATSYQVSINAVWRANSTSGAGKFRWSSAANNFSTLEMSVTGRDRDDINVMSYQFILNGAAETPIDIQLECMSEVASGIDLLHAVIIVEKKPEMALTQSPL